MKIISLVVGLTVGVLLMVGLVAPVVADGQTTAGDAVTFTNGSSTSIRMDYYDEDFTINISADGSATVGDYTVNPATTYPRIMFWEYGRINLNTTAGATTTLFVSDYRSAESVNVSGAGTVEYDAENHTITVSYGETVRTFTAYNVMAIKADGAYVMINASGMGAAYYTFSDAENGKLGYLDATTTYNGSNIEVIANKGGITIWGLPEGTEYTAKVTIENGTLVNGTTNVYQNGTPKFEVTIGEETIDTFDFRYGQAVLQEITGNKNSGANYALLGAIPLVAFIALIAFAAFAVRGRMDD